MIGRELGILSCDWLQEMAVVQHCRDEVRLQQTANTIALMARRLSKDPNVSAVVFYSDPTDNETFYWNLV